MTTFVRTLFGIAVSFLGIVAATCSFAEAQVGEVEACALIKNDHQRLECFDLKFRKSTTVLEPQNSAWTIKEERSKIDDSSNIFLILKSSDTIRNQYGAKSTLDLIVTCREKQTDLYFTFGGYFMSSLNGRGNVIYRVDAQPAKKKMFEESNDHKALGLWSASGAIPFIKELIGGSTLFIRATPFSDSAVSAEFKIFGIEEALKPLRAACKWAPTPAPTAAPMQSEPSKPPPKAEAPMPKWEMPQPTVKSEHTASEMDLVREQVSPCWNVPAGAREAKDLVVQIRIAVKPDGTVQQATIVDQARSASDPLFRAAAESARRTFFNPSCTPLKLPADKYEVWKDLVVGFNPKDIL